MNNEPLFLVVDLFCGFGGTTTGFTQATIGNYNIAKVIACVNHDPKAIKSHWLNHKDVKHFNEDIRTLDLTELVKTVNYWRNKYPSAYLILWGSLECTNFSKAKGGQARDADSRTLADHLPRYIKALNPDYIQIENVVEFMSWGPLDKNGKPINRRNGQDWLRWRKEICTIGYRDEWKELNSANFGAYTSRNRLFGCFVKDGLPIIWPTPTHNKVKGKAVKIDMFGPSLKPWKAVKEVLNFDDEGESIFNRKKPLSDKTLERIYAGLLKFIANGDTSFISKYFSGKPEGKVISTSGPAGTITTADGQSLITTEYLIQTYAGRSITTVDNPSNTITTRYHPHLVQPKFMASYYGNGHNVSSVDSVCPTIPTKDKISLIQAEYFIDTHYKNTQNQSINQPAGTIMPTDKYRLVQCDHFIMPTSYDNKPKSIEEPCPTITANRKHHYIVNPSHGGHSTSTDVPCPIIIARQDKAPLYLVQAEKGSVAVAVFDCDSEIMIKIKQFMSAYGLVDIKMRMLRVIELLRIQGFSENYKMVGNQTDQKKFIGNSVVPHVVKAWCEVMGGKLIDMGLTKLKAA